MKAISLREMKKGYFIGDFVPCVLSSKDVEVCNKGASKYTLDAAYYRKNDTRIIYVTSGKIDIDGKVYGRNSVIRFEPGEVINLFALANSEMIIMNFPGTKGDLCRVVWDDFNELDRFYNSYMTRLLKECDGFLPSEKSKGIDPKEVSVVIQGYFDPNITKNTLASIRKYLPGAKIIVSTWEECNCEGIDCDRLIKSSDPGACECGLFADIPISNNGNRQIVSTKAGIDAVDTKYTLKLRSDLVLLGADILKLFDMFPSRESDYSIFSHRIIIGELYTRNDFVYRDPKGKVHRVPKPFHPSDWFYFGLTIDLKLMYDNIDLIPKNEMADYTCKFPERVSRNKYKYSWRYTSEQHIFMGCVRKKYPKLGFEDWTDWNDEVIELSEKIMMNNFTILSFCQHKILNMKYIPECYANSGAYYKERALMTNKQICDYFGM